MDEISGTLVSIEVKKERQPTGRFDVVAGVHYGLADGATTMVDAVNIADVLAAILVDNLRVIFLKEMTLPFSIEIHAGMIKNAIINAANRLLDRHLGRLGPADFIVPEKKESPLSPLKYN